MNENNTQQTTGSQRIRWGRIATFAFVAALFLLLPIYWWMSIGSMEAFLIVSLYLSFLIPLYAAIDAVLLSAIMITYSRSRARDKVNALAEYKIKLGILLVFNVPLVLLLSTLFFADMIMDLWWWPFSEGLTIMIYSAAIFYIFYKIWKKFTNKPKDKE